MEKITLNSSVSALPGVGKARKEQLNRLKIFTVKDLLYHFPRAYENRGDIKTLSNAVIGQNCSYRLTVATEVKSVMIRKGFTISKFRAFDESGSVEVVFFNSPFVKDVFHSGTEFRFYGKTSVTKNTFQLMSPKYEPVIDGMPLPDFVPIYSLTEGLTSKYIEKLISTSIDNALRYIDDPLPDKIRIKNALPTITFAIKNIHKPTDNEALFKSIKRLAFDELLCFGLAVSRLSHYKAQTKGVVFSPCDLSPVLSLLPYELTNSQKHAVNDIYRDTVISPQNGGASMARIIVGDVGCGKTVCALLAAYIAASSGFQVALMAPTEILARQHYNDFYNIFSKLNIKVKLLIGSTKQSEKKEIYKSIEDGSLSILIGTHALLSENVNFKNLGLIITDEQHRFGVKQRAVLKEKTEAAHMLVMSATPIPRTLALTLYGDLDISRITEMPSGRKRVDTYVVDESYRERLIDFIKKQISLGGQCYIVCPSIEQADNGIEAPSDYAFSSESDELKNVLDYTEFLKEKLPGIKIESMHGKMKPSEKDEIMNRFLLGEISCLVSTTVIEVGVNVPNASLMIIENAERFGLSQLHQLRGRVGRGSRKSYCVLVHGSKGDRSSTRLEIMRTVYDGFEIAEKDLIERGPGNFFASTVNDESIKQSGGFEFKIAGLNSETELIEAAFKAAKEIINEDPDLIAAENLLLKKEILRYSISNFSTIS